MAGTGPCHRCRGLRGGDMTWLLSTRIGRAVASAVALLAVGLTFLTLDRRKTRNEAVDEVMRRADASAEKRREERDAIDDDIRGIDARDELRESWTRDE